MRLMHDGGKNDPPVVRAEVGGQVFTDFTVA